MSNRVTIGIVILVLWNISISRVHLENKRVLDLEGASPPANRLCLVVRVCASRMTVTFQGALLGIGLQ